MSIILNGIKFGIILTFLVGPVFFAIVQTSVERGFVKGLLVSIGVSVSDAFYVIVCYLGLIQLIEEDGFRQQMAYVGGAILIVFGVYHIAMKSRKSMAPPKAADEKSGYRYLLKGFLINAFSPMVPLFWIGTIGVASIDFGYTRSMEFTLFFGVLLGTVLVTDIAKAYLAGRLRALITPHLMMWMNIVVGIALTLFGLRLFLLGINMAG